ncbi:MAG: 6-phosphofructokinase [Actinobacteria bacterium]|nr:6-phosphofructokinase [Actinomycetota bacterium]
MPTNIKRIGVLTGGGDCPGLNAVIRAVTKTAIWQHGIEVFGIEDGFQGLIEDRVRPLTARDASGILTRGGTILGSNNRCNPKRYCVRVDPVTGPVWENVTDRCVDTARRHGLDAIIVIGGDGTMASAAPLVEAGVNIIGVPKTIDNDIVGTEITFGFLTAVNTCEVMGRNAGWIALTAGVASGSDIILLPEIPFDLDHLAENVRFRMRKGGPGFAIIVAAEGARPREGQQVVDRVDPTSPDPIRLGGIGRWVADELAKRTGVETRSSALGHIQRGGGPIPADRILATHFGYHAIKTLMEGKRGRMVVRQGNVFADVDLLFAAGKQRLVPVDHPLIEAARAIGTGFGDGRTPEPAPHAEPMGSVVV